MKNLNSIAKDLLIGDGYTITTSRINKLSSFLENYRLDQICLVENNNWSKPPAPTKLADYAHIGGTTYKYQIWAVVYK